MNENKKMSFVDFLIQLIFIILFVMVLVWLFPTKDWLKQNYFNTEDDYIIEKDSTISDSKFVDNINNMLDASKDYFGYSVNLPEKIGDTVTVTLDELVDNHVMLMPKDNKGNKCDGNSNAVITKLNNGYSIKVTLTCGNVTDYIIRNVGCNPFCENNCTQTCKLEYQYSKNIDGYYTNWSFWSVWSIDKKIASKTLKVEQKTVTSKICPTGYELNSNKTACIKTVKNEEIKAADIVKSCPSGYEMNSDKTLCVRKENSSISIDATKIYSCPSGYTLNGNSCYKTISIDSTRTDRKTCISGYTYIGSNMCQKVSVLQTIGSSDKGAECSISYELDCTNTCKTIAKETCVVKANTVYNYSCPSDYTLSSDKKTCTKTETINADYNYTCNSGILDGDKCIIDNTKEETIDVIVTYVCKDGTVSDNKCIIVSENTESVEYTLKNVVYYRYATRKYVDATVSYKWSSSKEDKTLINAGYKLTGKTRQNCSK